MASVPPTRFNEFGNATALATAKDWHTAGPLGLALRGLPAAARAEVRAEIEDSLGRFAAADGYELPGVALCAVAS